MKSQLIFLIVLIMIVPLFSIAQVKIPVKKKVEKKTENEANEAVDNAIDNTFNKLLGKKKKTSSKKVTENPTQETEEVKTEGNDATEPLKPWSKFDFVPGDVVIFEDDLILEENGEFPSKWDLINGYAENALFGGENVIRFTHNYGGAKITPLMNEEGDYLPEKFTLEFDMYLSKRTSKYVISFWDQRERRPVETNELGEIAVGYAGKEQGASYMGGQMSSAIEAGDQLPFPHWRHVAISFNIRALKVYIDQYRLLNIPNVKGNPMGITIHASTYDFGDSGNFPTLIKNIRLAKGAVKLYDRFLTDGKIITNGIKFDVNKATIKPESMGVINQIYKLMEEHPEISFSVDGHTDSDGEESMNLSLSQDRALAVVGNLVEMGIAQDRLMAKGLGESMPITDNNTPEGKANNRRVEFVKVQTM
jgi:OOP family OmpA-OmpF porin